MSENLVLIHHCMLLSVSLFSFSLVLFARVFLFSLAPAYFFLLSSHASLRNRRPLHWNTVTHFQVPHPIRNHRSYPIWFTHFSRSSRMTFFLSLSLFIVMQNRWSLAFIILLTLAPSFLRSILLHFSRDRFLPILFFTVVAHAFSFPSLSLSFSQTPPLLSSSVIRSSRLRCSVSSSPPFQLSSIFRDVFSSQRWHREEIISHIVLHEIIAFPKSEFVLTSFS